MQKRNAKLCNWILIQLHVADIWTWQDSVYFCFIIIPQAYNIYPGLATHKLDEEHQRQHSTSIRKKVLLISADDKLGTSRHLGNIRKHSDRVVINQQN